MSANKKLKNNLKINEQEIKVNDKNENEIRKSIANTCLMIGSLFLIFLATTLIIATIFYFSKLKLSFLVPILAILFSIIWYWFVSKQYNCKQIIIPLGFFAILCVCIFVSGSFYDFSYDGQSYHQRTVIELINGFNPVYDHSTYSITNTYPRAAETNAAALYMITDDIEKSKASNIILIITTFLIALASILTVTELNIQKSFLIASLAALNPVSIYQSLSYMVDGQFACLIACFLFLVLLTSKKTNILTLIPLASASILLVNIKATGFAYTLLFSVGFLAFMWYYQKDKFMLVLKYLTVAFLIGALFVGYHPYVTNTLVYHNPFYPVPLLGGLETEGGAAGIFVTDIPMNFQNQPPLTNLIKSVFSQQKIYTAASEFKIPFVFSFSELAVFKEPDARVSGFGVLFSGAIVLCFVSVICLLKKWKFDILKNPFTSIKLLIIFLLVISILINSYSWWARYAPQLWLLPIFSLLFVPLSKDTLLKYSQTLLMLTLIINIVMISMTYYTFQSEGTAELNREMDILSSLNQEIKIVDDGYFVATERRLNERGIKYEKISEQNNLTQSYTLFESYVNFYLPENSS